MNKKFILIFCLLFGIKGYSQQYSINKLYDFESAEKVDELSRNSIITPDGKYFIAGLDNGNIGVWDLEQGILIKTLTHFSSSCSILSISCSSDGKRIASICREKIIGGKCSIKIWNLLSWDVEKTFTKSDFEYTAYRAVFSPNSNFLALGDTKSILIYDLTKKKIINRITEEGGVYNLAFISDNQIITLASTNGGYAKYLKCWNIENNKVENRIFSEKGFGWELLSVSKNLNFLATISGENIEIWDCKNFEKVTNIVGSANFHFTSDEKYVFTTIPSFIKIQNIENPSLLKTYEVEYSSKPRGLVLDETRKILISFQDKNLSMARLELKSENSDKPTISFISPKNNQKADTNFIEVKATIFSKSPIKDVKILIDGKVYNTRDFDITAASENYQINYNQIINVIGDNRRIKLELKVENENGITSESRIVLFEKTIKTDIIVNPITIKERRIALVIGNSDYQNGNSLLNPKNDADSIEFVLQKIGFLVIKKKNLTLLQTNSIIKDFSQQLKNYDVGLFFYAGHGIELDGNNYIIPVDADKLDKSDVQYKCINTSWLQDKMAEAGAYEKTNIIILDACRNNPFRGWRSFSGDDDLWTPPSNIPSGVITAFAASQGQKAADGNGTNGLYTSILLKHIRTKGLDIERLFKRVRIELKQKGGQEPVEMNKLTKDFYFVPQQ